MFRLARNDHKEMFGRTITELRELRAELSLLKDRLSLIIPGEGDSGRDQCLPAGEQAESGEAKAVGNIPASLAIDPGRAERQAAVAGAGADDPCGEDVAELVETSAGAELETWADIGDGDGAEDSGKEIPEREAGGETRAAAAASRRDWAVVNYCPEKRSWWKFWDHKSHRAGPV